MATRPSVLAGEAVDDGARVAQEVLLEQQVLGRIAGDRALGEQDEAARRPRARGLERGGDPLLVAGEVADDGVDLGAARRAAAAADWSPSAAVPEPDSSTNARSCGVVAPSRPRAGAGTRAPRRPRLRRGGAATSDRLAGVASAPGRAARARSSASARSAGRVGGGAVGQQDVARRAARAAVSLGRGRPRGRAGRVDARVVARLRGTATIATVPASATSAAQRDQRRAPHARRPAWAAGGGRDRGRVRRAGGRRGRRHAGASASSAIAASRSSARSSRSASAS